VYDADKVKVPMLIEQGANDRRAVEKNSDMMVAALRANHVPVTYVVYPDEGHVFYRAENNIDSMARIDVFLQKCLGGRAEPFDKIDGSSAELH
jgi:dipeptidyl aminopeptidase/acylaminoacyl peptidase